MNLFFGKIFLVDSGCPSGEGSAMLPRRLFGLRAALRAPGFCTAVLRTLDTSMRTSVEPFCAYSIILYECSVFVLVCRVSRRDSGSVAFVTKIEEATLMFVVKSARPSQAAPGISVGSEIARRKRLIWHSKQRGWPERDL